MRTDLSFNSYACSTFQKSVCYNTQLFALIAQRSLPQVSGNAFVQVFPPSSETARLLCCVSLKVQQCTEQEAKTQCVFFFMGDCNRGLFKDAVSWDDCVLRLQWNQKTWDQKTNILQQWTQVWQAWRATCVFFFFSPLISNYTRRELPSCLLVQSN